MALTLIALVSGVLGYTLRNTLQGYRHGLQRSNYYLLLGLVATLFASIAVDLCASYLVPTGALLVAVPALIGAALHRRHAEWGQDLLIFATYGGGNRGVLVITLAQPALLPRFLRLV